MPRPHWQSALALATLTLGAAFLALADEPRISKPSPQTRYLETVRSLRPLLWTEDWGTLPSESDLEVREFKDEVLVECLTRPQWPAIQFALSSGRVMDVHFDLKTKGVLDWSRVDDWVMLKENPQKRTNLPPAKVYEAAVQWLRSHLEPGDLESMFFMGIRPSSMDKGWMMAWRQCVGGYRFHYSDSNGPGLFMHEEHGLMAYIDNRSGPPPPCSTTIKTSPKEAIARASAVYREIVRRRKEFGSRMSETDFPPGHLDRPVECCDAPYITWLSPGRNDMERALAGYSPSRERGVRLAWDVIFGSTLAIGTGTYGPVPEHPVEILIDTETGDVVLCYQ